MIFPASFFIFKGVAKTALVNEKFVPQDGWLYQNFCAQPAFPLGETA